MTLPLLTAAVLLTYNTFIFDLDGVLKTDTVIAQAPEIVNYLYEKNKEVLFVSNNDWETAEQRAVSFHQTDFIHAAAEDFVNPLQVLDEYFTYKNYYNKTIYLMAPPAVKNFLEIHFGAKVMEMERQKSEFVNFKTLGEDIKIKPDAVIMDSYNGYTYENLAKAINFVRDPSVDFFVLSGDDRYRPGFNLLMPDSGAFRTVVETISERKAIPFGKPSKALNNFLIKKKSLAGKKAIMFGDNLNTDITMANELGIDSCLMLTGVHSLGDVNQATLAGKKKKIPVYQGNFTLLAKELNLLRV